MHANRRQPPNFSIKRSVKGLRTLPAACIKRWAPQGSLGCHKPIEATICGYYLSLL